MAFRQLFNPRRILMNKTLCIATVLSTSLIAGALYATPQHLTTHNNTNVESNAFIDGTIPSVYPTPAKQTRNVPWIHVMIACVGHTTNDICSALIKMKTNTKNPVTIGNVKMNVKTGDITPKELSANGYLIQVNGPGEVTLTTTTK